MTLIDKAEALAIVNGYWQSIGVTLLDAIAERIAALPARGVGVKPLQWKQAGGNIKAGDGFSAWPDLIHAPLTIYRKRDGWWLSSDCKTHPTLEAAKAAAQADYEARILAALTTALDPALAERAGEVLPRLRKADEYEPLGYDGWEAADLITALLAQNAALREGRNGSDS